MRFKNRDDAGEKLADALREWKGSSAVIFALPRGGVVVAHKVAQALNLPMDLVIVRKVGHPSDPEFAIAAVTEDGAMVKNDQEVSRISQDVFDQCVLKEKAEAARRSKKYLEGVTRVDVEGKTVLLVDDGIATGLTIKAAIARIKGLRAREIIVAVPVAPADTVEDLKKYADRVLCLYSPDVFFGAIGGYYDSFAQVSDEEVVSIMKKYRTP